MMSYGVMVYHTAQLFDGGNYDEFINPQLMLGKILTKLYYWKFDVKF